MVFVARVEDVPEGGKTLTTVNGQGIGLFKLNGQIFAWRNTCPHQGGPVCQGRIFHRVVENIDADRQVHGRAYDTEHQHIVCPWHGAEFNIRTGRHAGTDALSLTPITIEILNDEIHADVD